jgi:hypothetical protein
MEKKMEQPRDRVSLSQLSFAQILRSVTIVGDRTTFL